MSVIDYGTQARRLLGRTVHRNRFRLGLDDGLLDPEATVRSLPEGTEPHLLFLCYGNICRSPLAEHYARERLVERDVPATVESAGFHDTVDRASPDTAVAAATEHAVDLEDHRSKRATEAMLRTTDIVLLMDVRNYRHLQREFSEAVEKAAFLRAFGDGTRWSFEIADPYDGDRGTFDEAYDQVATSIDGLVERLAARHDHR